jgi:hypothetical protein
MGIPLIPLMGTSSTHPVQPDNLLDDAARAAQIGGLRQQQAQSSQLFLGQLARQGIENQLGQQAVESGALDIAQRKAINDAWKSAAVSRPDGSIQIDPDGLTNALAMSGHGSAIPAIAKGLLDMQEQKDKIATSKSSLAAAEADAAGAGAQAVIASAQATGVPDANVKAAFFQHMHDAGYDAEAQQLQQHLAQYQNNPQGEMQLWKSVVAQSPKQQQLAAETMQAQARMLTAQKPTEASLASDAAGGDEDATAALGILANQKGQITPAVRFQQAQENYRAALSRQASTANELQKQGISNLQKQSDTYSQFLNTSQSLKNSLAAATNGNEMAAAVAPLQGTLFVTTAEGVKRINNTELQGVEGAGSLVQRINGELGKQTGKGPLSDQLKQDMASLVDIYTDSKYANYQKQAAYTQKLHGLDPNMTPILAKDGSISGQQGSPSARAGGTVQVTAPDGSVHTFPDQKSADAFKKLAGIP